MKSREENDDEDGGRVQDRRECQTAFQQELAVVKDEPKNVKMGSGRTVCSEASTGIGLGSGTFAPPPSLTSRWSENFHSEENGIQKVGSLFER